ncbi:MAG TPA: thioredoxin domain-containing protein, partial [Thermoanaerobaculia bacterium]|nr:thioredoxin domain-containing protein [Thermoanaerobaculia bacterium]
ATTTLEAAWPLAERYPSGFGFLLSVAEWRAGSPKEIAITGDPADESFRALRAVIGETFLPHRVLVSGNTDLPLMEGRNADTVMAHVCEGYACQEPTRDAARLRELL